MGQYSLFHHGGYIIYCLVLTLFVRSPGPEARAPVDLNLPVPTKTFYGRLPGPLPNRARWPWRAGSGSYGRLPFKFEISLPNAIFTTQRYFCSGYFLLVGPLGWTPRLCLSNSTIRSLTRFLLHNDILAFWLDPSPLTFKGEISLPNAILTTQRYFGAVVVFGWTPRP